jgi:CRP-like cAMP-binding protein
VVRAHPELAQRLLEVLCGRLRKTSEQLEDAFFLDMPGRLAKALLAARTAAPGGGVQVQLTQRELGEMIGTARESVNKVLHTWQRDGLVDLRRGAIAIRQPEGLELLARGDAAEE